MAITKPLLPPKAGYVEVVDENGNHVYKPTADTKKKLEEQKSSKQLRADIDFVAIMMGVDLL